MTEIFESKGYKDLLKSLSLKLDIEYPEVEAKASKYLEELQSEQEDVIHTLGVQLAEYILGRGYEQNIDVDPVQLKELSRWMRQHPIAFVMTHKTYIDMFVLGVVLARHGLRLPYIFAGINMAFMGLSQLGRKAGTIFIRRDISDNEIYKACLRFYIAYLVDQSAHFMWAIEGTRSRTGKLVWPKMGILKYILEAEQQSKQTVKYIPVSIVYDLIPDVEEMTKETRGKVKSKESLSWFLDYVRKMGNDFGKISIRFGNPVSLSAKQIADSTTLESINRQGDTISLLALELMHAINSVTPVTTVSLLLTALLSKFALTKRSAEYFVKTLMDIIVNHNADCLVDRGSNLGFSIQRAINLLLSAGYIQQIGEGLNAKYSIVPQQYVNACYYANMSFHHLYHRAFIELALAKVEKTHHEERLLAFWREVMNLRELFKFEFFYSKKSVFTDQIEKDLNLFNPDWEQIINSENFNIAQIFGDHEILISQVVLKTYLEAYRVVAYTLLNLEEGRTYNNRQLLRYALFTGEELHWKGQIHRIDSVSKPFIENGLRYAKYIDCIPTDQNRKQEKIKTWLNELDQISDRMKMLQDTLEIRINIEPPHFDPVHHVPGHKLGDFTEYTIEGESGAHIGAFFDLDRTLISEFSARQFFQSRVTSGKMTPNEIVAQFSGLIVYGLGNKNFAGLASIGAKGIKGIDEKVFMELGEEVYLKHLAKTIYPESRALVEAHLAKGHTVAIISAATPYQVTPIARDLDIEHIMCTKLKVKNGKFTGKIVDPPCWGEGKSHAAISLAKKHKLDLQKSYFYTDSVSDLPLLEIVGYPRPVNPDSSLTKIAFENEWPILRFDEESRPKISGAIRTALAFGSLIPAAVSGMAIGASQGSWQDGVNSMTSVVGDLGCFLAGIRLVVKGSKHMWSNRPAVFIFNHQSNVDLLIMAKLLRKDAVGIAKKELLNSPAGPFLKAGGVIFVDRKDRQKAIEALKPAVDALKSGTSIGIAPEGTRSYDYNLGPFKKGAFHLAMQAGVPVIPVVIKNAHDAMPRGSNLINPTVVEVKVLKPIHVDGWNKKNLDANIEKVRNKFLKTLGQ